MAASGSGRTAVNSSTAVAFLMFAVAMLYAPPAVEAAGCFCMCPEVVSGCVQENEMEPNGYCTCKTQCGYGGCSAGYEQISKKRCTLFYEETCKKTCQRPVCKTCKPSYYGPRCSKRCACNGGKCTSTITSTESTCVCFSNHGFTGPQCTGGVFTYSGCYIASSGPSSPRILPVRASGSSAQAMNVPYCYYLAANKYHATAFGLEKGDQCWVGNVTTSHIRDNFKASWFGACGVACAGDPALSCGGNVNAMDVYTINST